MGQTVTGGGEGGELGVREVSQKLEKGIFVEDVRILTKVMEIEVPKYIPKEQIKYVNKEEEQVKYNTREEETVKYNVIVSNTTKFNTVEERTTKYIPVEEETVKYKVKEEPTVKYKLVLEEQTILQLKDLEEIKGFLKVVPDIRAALVEIEQKLKELKAYKVVEELVKTQKIQFIPTEVERIVWKDVSRERCTDCGKEITE